jgi:hypothetical protein
MVDHLPFNRNSFAPRFGANLAPDLQRWALIAGKLPRTEGWHPAGRGAIDRDPPRVTRRASLVVAPGQARHDRSTSGLPARGCPMGPRWSSDSRSSTCLHVYPRPGAKETLDFRAKQEMQYVAARGARASLCSG